MPMPALHGRRGSGRRRGRRRCGVGQRCLCAVVGGERMRDGRGRSRLGVILALRGRRGRTVRRLRRFLANSFRGLKAGRSRYGNGGSRRGRSRLYGGSRRGRESAVPVRHPVARSCRNDNRHGTNWRRGGLDCDARHPDVVSRTLDRGGCRRRSARRGLDDRGRYPDGLRRRVSQRPPERGPGETRGAGPARPDQRPDGAALRLNPRLDLRPKRRRDRRGVFRRRYLVQALCDPSLCFRLRRQGRVAGQLRFEFRPTLGVQRAFGIRNEPIFVFPSSPRVHVVCSSQRSVSRSFRHP